MLSSSPDFSPTLLHPFYFVRKNLRDCIYEKAHHLGGKLLDFGCGSKPYKSFFAVEEYIGVDFENEGHPHDHENIDLIYDGNRIPVADSYFDSILCSEVFEHIFNLEHILDELHRVLKKDGKIIITCPFVWNEHEIPFDFARYTEFALKHLLSRHGFEIVEFEKTGNFVVAIAQLSTLYFYTVFYKRVSTFFLFRWLYKFFFVFSINCGGIILDKLLPTNKSLYLNNIIVAKKV